MTDRSSEERSRFEKWWTAELLSGKTWTSADIDNMELAWRAALDDRQEAAPGFMDLIRKWRASADKSERHLGGNDSAENETHMRDMRVCADELEAILPTTGDCGRQEAAPEVMRCENCEAEIFFDTTWNEWYHTERPRTTPSCGNPMPGVPSEAIPSKENAPLPDHLFGSCRNNRDPELCAGCERIQNSAAPVPEGVQGKEPQTFDEFWKVEKEALLARVVCRCSAGSTCDSSAVHVDKFAKEVFVSGEAAGRRSAITVLQKLEENEYNHGRGVGHFMFVAWCDELQEKTK